MVPFHNLWIDGDGTEKRPSYPQHVIELAKMMEGISGTRHENSPCIVFAKSLKDVMKGERISVTTIQPKGEKLRQAVRWISEEKQEGKEKGIQKLIREAGLRFNLSPKEEEYLISFYDEGKERNL